MGDAVVVSDLRYVVAVAVDRARGLLGFLSFAIGPLHLDGVTVRRTRDGHLTLSYPIRHDSRGAQHPIVRPVDGAARRAIEAQVIAALGIKSEERAP